VERHLILYQCFSAQREREGVSRGKGGKQTGQRDASYSLLPFVVERGKGGKKGKNRKEDVTLCLRGKGGARERGEVFAEGRGKGEEINEYLSLNLPGLFQSRIKGGGERRGRGDSRSFHDRAGRRTYWGRKGEGFLSYSVVRRKRKKLP